jgi:hypothetical protein
MNCMDTNREDVRRVVNIVLLALGRIAVTTRTPADDLMVGILKGNEAKLVDAVVAVLQQEGSPTEARVAEALRGVGIKTA